MIQPHLREMIDRESKAANDAYAPSRLTKLLFGQEGDWLDRHQGLTLAIVCMLALIVGAV